MKTLIKSLLIAFTVSLVTISASQAEANPGKNTSTVATYKTGIYTTLDGKLQIALDKETNGAVDIKLKSADGELLFVQHLNKKENKARIRLTMSELQDGTYQVEVTNGVDTTTHSVTISTQQASTPGRLVAIN
ncbi:hypothetical protein [Spirosoma agri]|uniref:Secretion system C-terminal sorting domain-containing protein n=1 Tax=Spirosoma agri TaxID=1987381 RepID=A0A6M0IRK2_9BACT|nr:hypothetical protein [Spirosoma agri]NEU70714.1 hypothetical protein [Spirosoma agri]